MPLKRSSVRTTALRRRGATGGSITFIPHATSGTPRSSSAMSLEDYIARQEAQARVSIERTVASSQISLARWVQQQEYSLIQRQDTDALARIGKGDAIYGITYAERRLADPDVAGDPRQVAFWNDVLRRAQTKAEDNAISGLISSGQMREEDLLRILRDRRDRTDPGSLEFKQINQQIAGATKALETRRFNERAAAVESSYLDSRDKQRYLRDLTGLYAVATPGEQKNALRNRIVEVQKLIDADDAAKQQRKVSELMLDYYGGSKSKSDVLNELALMTSGAKTTQEAQRYVSLAQQIVAYDRQVQQDRLRAAGTAARTGATAAKNAVDAVLRDDRANLKDAAMHIKERIIDRGLIPTEAEWAIYWAAGDGVRNDAGKILAQGVAANVGTTLANEIRTLDKQREDFKVAAGINVTQRAAALEQQIKKIVAAAKAEGRTDASAYDAARDLVVELQRLRTSDFIKGNPEQEGKVQSNIDDALAPVRTEAQKAAAAIYDPSKSEVGKAMQAEYDKFKTAWLKSHNVFEGAPTPQEWAAAIREGTSFAEVAQRLKMTDLSDPEKVLPDSGFTADDVVRVREIMARDQRESERALETWRAAKALEKGVSPAAAKSWYPDISGNVLQPVLDSHDRAQRGRAGEPASVAFIGGDRDRGGRGGVQPGMPDPEEAQRRVEARVAALEGRSATERRTQLLLGETDFEADGGASPFDDRYGTMYGGDGVMPQISEYEMPQPTAGAGWPRMEDDAPMPYTSERGGWIGEHFYAPGAAPDVTGPDGFLPQISEYEMPQPTAGAGWQTGDAMLPDGGDAVSAAFRYLESDTFLPLPEAQMPVTYDFGPFEFDPEFFTRSTYTDIPDVEVTVPDETEATEPSGGGSEIPVAY